MRILIVEDDEKHQMNARWVCGNTLGYFGYTCEFVETLEEAEQLLSSCDGVLSDVFFPAKKGESPNPELPPPGPIRGFSQPDKEIEYAEKYINGVRLAERAKSLGLPVVLCTSSYHHGTMTQPVCTWSRNKTGVPLIDNEGVTDALLDKEATRKNWAMALLILIAQMQKKEAVK